MKIRLDRDALAEAVTWTARALSPRPPAPVLAGLLLSADGDTLTLSGFDYETAARTTIPAEVGDPGQALVSGRLLSDIVKSLPAKPVDLTLDGTKVLLRCGASKFTLLTMPVDEYPSLPGMPDGSGTVRADVFQHATAQVTVAASRDETLPILTGVRMELGADTITLLATDRYRLAMRTIPWTMAGGPRTLDVIPAVLVRSRTLSEVAKTLAPGVDVTLGVGDSHVGFQAASRQVTSLLIDGEYPKVRSLFPASADSVAVVDRDALTAAVRRVALVAERHTPVRLTFNDGAVTLEAGQGEDAQAAETVDATYSKTAPFVVSFNPQFLLDGLGAVGTPFVRFSFVESANPKPAVLTGQAEMGGDDDDGYKYLIMPVRA